jgi:beta-glucanase (GH16 family)
MSMNRKARTPHQILYPAILISVSLLVLVLAIPTVSAQPAFAPARQTGWNLVWSDEFSGTGQPDPTNWNYVVGNGWNPGSASFDGWGNGEWEWYRPENAYQSGGNLVIRADYSSTPLFVAGGRNWYQTSARITTKGKRSIQYGAVEARIQLPNQIASWPAFWMLGDESDDTNTSNYAAPSSYYDINSSNWSSIGEIDILEHKNDDPWTFQNLFWDSRTGVFPWNCCTNVDSPSTHDVNNVTAFHTYRLEWTASTLTWLIDGNVVKTKDVSAANQEEFRKPFHIYLNMAIAGRFPGTQPNQADFPLFMNVDYVRVYSTPGPIPTPTPVHTNGSWNLSWSDEFSGTGQPDPTNWNYVVGNGWNPGSASFDGWGNGEWEWYRPENAYQSGGNLVIRADYSSTPLFVAGGRNWYQTSARITTKGKRSIQYGAVEARIQLPNQIASWPAFWMLGDESDDTNTSNYAAPSSYYDINSSKW